MSGAKEQPWNGLRVLRNVLRFLFVIGSLVRLCALQLGDRRHIESKAVGIKLVITRPLGRNDVRYQIIARPLFQHVENSRANVGIEVLKSTPLILLTTCLISWPDFI
jgi:hypothetical protein